MSVLSLIAEMKAHPGKEAELEALLRGVVEPTRAEAGCLNYDLHAAIEEPGRFVFYENWRTRAHWDAHNASAHIARLREAGAALIAEKRIVQLTKIS